MSPVTTRGRRLISWLDKNAEIYLMSTFYIYIIAIIGIEVFRRFVLNQSSVWGSEIAQMMFIYLTWIGVSWGVYNRIHIRIDFIHQYLSDRSSNLLYIVGDLCLLLFAYNAIVLTIPVIQDSLTYGATTPALRVNRAYFLMAIPIGCGLMIIRTLQAMYDDVQRFRNGEPVNRGESLFEDHGEDPAAQGETDAF